jgi:RHS repeat-associated protein
MRLSPSFLPKQLTGSIIPFRRRPARSRVICLAVAFSLLLWSEPVAGARDFFDFVSRSAAVAIDTRAFSSSYEAYFIKTLLSRSAQTPHAESMTERIAQVAKVQVNPWRCVGYIGQTVAFRALPFNSNDQIVQGVRFDWESSDADKVVIDGTGHARLLTPGLVRITCRAGAVQSSVPLLVRFGTRPRQSDAEWQNDQQSLSVTSVGSTTTPLGRLAASLLSRLTPTAQAQNGWNDDLAYDELWNDPTNLVGSPDHRVTESTRAGTVLPEGSNFDFGLPIVNLGGRGVGVNLTLHYNSRIWSRRNTAMAYNCIVGWPGPGYSLGFGRIVTYEISAGGNPTCKYLLVDADGTRHYLGSGLWGGIGYALGGPFETNDGSHIIYTGNGRDGGTLYYPDGTSTIYTMVNNRLLPTSIWDTNGNYIQIAYKPECIQVGGNQYCDVFAPMALDYIYDTMGRVIQFNYDSNYRLISITTPGLGGTAQNPITQTIAQFDYESLTANGTFNGLTVERGAGSITTLKHIYLPATGTGYRLTNSIYGVVSTISGRRQMTATGNPPVISDGVESNNVTFNYPTSGPISDAPAFSTRSESATNASTASYSYTTSSNGVTQTKTFTITQPDNSTLNLTRSTNVSLVGNGLLTQSEVKTSSGSTMSKSVVAYANDPGGEPQVQSVISYDDASTPNQTKVDYDYDSYGNVSNLREYGFQVSGQFQVRKRTHNVYKTDSAYINAYQRSLLIERDVYDGLLNVNDSDDVLLAKSTYTFDDYNAMGGLEDYRDPITGQLPPNPPGHLIGINIGNLTGTSKWYDIANNLSYTWLRKIDVFGNVVKEQLSCCNEQTQMASQTYYWATPEEVVKGTTGGPQLTYTTNYDFNTLAINWDDDPNNQQTQYGYDSAMRSTQTTAPTGKSTTTAFNDGSLTTNQTVTYNGGDTQATSTTTSEADGWGRVIKQTNLYGGQVNTVYNAMGQISSVSNPFTAGGTPAYWTNYTYDALGRKTLVTLPDNQTLQKIYSGNSATDIDQVNRKMQRLSDGFGRVVTVKEQDSSGNLTQATSYTYDVLGNLTQLNQGNQLRTYKYDALSRRTGEKIPEQGDPTQQNQMTTTLTYTDFDAVSTRTDARGVVTTNTYDTLNRLTQASYNTVSGVTTAPTVTYSYDNYNGVSANGKLIRIAVGTDYEERYTFDSAFHVASMVRTIGTRSYTTSYGYNAGDQVTQTTYPSGQLLYYHHDNHGMTSSVDNGSGTSYVTSHSHDIAGQLSSVTFGNGVTEQYGYDPIRMQMISHKAGTTSPYTNRMDLAFSYSATSGQMGVGSTAGNAGQLIGVSGTINGVTESASFTYDNYWRLVTSNQTSNGSSAQRRFAYDRWNNRTGVWDATSGGTQIQSFNLQTVSFPGTGSAPTNRLVSATGGSTLNYTYDANGNVTSDGVHSYAYDSVNRVVSVDSGSTASYSYDHQNRRYKTTVGSAITHYIWEGNKVLAEHNGSTGALQVNYIYAGGRMILSGSYYLLSDQLSVRLILNTSGAVKGRQGHLPFGDDFAETGPQQQKQHFTSYERDSQSGTDYALNRTYSYSVGRFQSPDPSQSSDDASPQSANRYSYVGNAPEDYVDPPGLFRSEPEPGDPCGTNDGNEPPINLPFGCSVSLPPDPDHLAIIYTIMHEHTAFFRIGQREYLPNDKPGKPTGEIIDRSTLGAEAFMFGNAIIWRARTLHRTVFQTVIAYVRDSDHDGAWWYARGALLTAAALLLPDGTNECEELKQANFASTLLDVPYASVPYPAYQWWRGHNNAPGKRRVGHYVIQLGDTDFLDYDPSKGKK